MKREEEEEEEEAKLNLKISLTFSRNLTYKGLNQFLIIRGIFCSFADLGLIRQF